MNISYKWLKEYVDTTLTPEEVAAALTSTGLETGGVERVESVRGGLAGLTIGKVLTCEAHPDSDHLHVTTVDLGLPDGPVQIVCGAPNVAAGQTVVVAPVGTVLYTPEGETFKIKRSKIRGVESLGMICAEDEIGLGNSHDGIIVLADGAAAPGTPAAEFYNIEDDYVIEVDLTPNRIDAASHFGVARDLAAYLSCHDKTVRAHRPGTETFRVDNPSESEVSVEVADTTGVTRYCGLTIKGIKVCESPEWLRKHLSTIGMHPINNIVDITNFILHAFGQPLHAFDADTLSDSKIVVRRAEAGTKFTTLDEVEHTLDGADLMICDSSTPRCMAGVFGGLNSGITDSTVNIFIESACFNPTSVRRTARRHGISTDSSFRFERGVDPNGCMYGLMMAALLVKECAGGTITGEVVDIYPEPVAPARVDMQFGDFEKLIGRPIPRQTVDSILESLECRVSGQGDSMSIEVPTYRVDVTRPCDVIEDVLRIYGYNNISMSDELHASLSFKTPVDCADELRRTLSEQLTGAGFNEILNNSLSAEAYYAENTVFALDRCVRLLNPLSQDLSVLRQTLLYGGLESIAHNINRRNPNLSFYEFGNVYFRNPASQSTPEAPLAPYSESARIALWMTGMTRNSNWLRQGEESSAYDLKAAVANLLARAGIEAGFVPAEPDNIFSDVLDVRTAKGDVIGRAGVLRSKLLRENDIKVPVYFAELDWDKISRLGIRHNVAFTPLPKTQAVKRDLSLLLDKGVAMADIEAAIRHCEPKLLRGVELFDVYEGDKLPEGKKSYAISILLQDNEKTLQDKYIDKVMNKIIETLRRDFAAELR